MDFSARFLLVKPPSNEALQERLEKSGKDAPAIQKILEKLPQELDEFKASELFNTFIINGDLDEAARAMGEYIFEKADAELSNGKEGDDEMADAGASDAAEATVATESIDATENTNGDGSEKKDEDDGEKGEA